jgi:hypothetical protein
MEQQFPSQENPSENLPEDLNPDFRTTNDLQDAREQALDMLEAGRHKGKISTQVRQSVVALYLEIQGSSTVVRVDLMDHVVIGRRDPNEADVPELDLSPHAAYQLGISRRHAIIRRVGDHLEIQDLGSRNGTKVNGVALLQDESVPLADGDDITLGRMTLRLLLRKQN